MGTVKVVLLGSFVTWVIMMMLNLTGAEIFFMLGFFVCVIIDVLFDKKDKPDEKGS
jgi:hypothetical protein